MSACQQSLPAALAFLTCLLVAASIPPNVDKRGHRSTNNYDHVVFTQSWPGSDCFDAGSHKCAVPRNVTTWQVHGMWPTLGTTIGPNFCNNSWHFDVNQIQTLISQLVLFWPNLFLDTPYDDFWNHEWTKHGTCGPLNHSWSSEYEFFKTGLALNQVYSLDRALKSNNIRPSSEVGYSLQDIYSAIESAFGLISFSIGCVKDGQGNQYLNQVELCLTTDLSQPIQCPTKTADPGTCSSVDPVLYPVIKSGFWTRNGTLPV